MKPSLVLTALLLALLALGAPRSLPLQHTQAADEAKKPAPPTPAAPYVKLPATRNAKANRYFCIRPDTNCQSIKWIVPSGLETIDPEIQVKDPNVGVFIGETGTYTVTAYGALNGQASDPATCTVTIGSPPPTPPGPAPPGPTPPPGPAPPADLMAALQAAWGQETDPAKAANASLLAALYKTASTTTVNDATLKTLGDLFNEMKAADAALLSAAALPKTRAAVGTYLAAQLGTIATDPLDSASRAKAGAVFGNVAAVLGGLK